jgi:hypothetical protein
LGEFKRRERSGFRDCFGIFSLSSFLGWIVGAATGIFTDFARGLYRVTMVRGGVFVRFMFRRW